jgi:tetratricopeptide (TPR) repeat protein
MELVLNCRRRDPFELLGVDPEHVTTTAHLRFLSFAEKFAPWRFDEDLTSEAQEVFLAGARAYARLCDPDRRNALLEKRATPVKPTPRAAVAERFKVKTDLLDSEKQFREGLKLVRAGDLVKALDQLEFAADLEPQNARYRAELAYCRYRLDPEGSTKEAVEALNEAIRIDPHCGLALYYTGEILRHSGKFDEAQVFLKRSLKPMAPDRRPVDALRALSQDRKASL